MNYQFYDIVTGIFSGRSYSGPSEHLIDNTPPNCAAKIGVFDHLSQKVDLSTGKVVDYVPDSPKNDDNKSWAWNPDIKRWVANPTLLANKTSRISAIQSAIDAQERMQDRPLRELMTAFRLSLPVPIFAANKMASIDAEILRLRGLRTAILAATTTVQLDAIPRP
jgi:hypothetical protein